MSASVANELSKYEMFLQNPSIYVGNCSNDSGEFYTLKNIPSLSTETVPALSVETKRSPENEAELTLVRTTWSSILLKMFDELLMNCLDNFQASKRTKTPMTFIKISFDSESISISNNGKAISLQKNANTVDGKTIYNPELIFSRLFTSTHYQKKDENIAGMNGIGAKIATVFSHHLHLRIVNNGISYVQDFIPNSKTIEASVPEFEDLSLDQSQKNEKKTQKHSEKTGKGKSKIENLTEITFYPDFKKIGSCDSEIFNGTIQMFLKRLIDVKLMLSVKNEHLQIFINGSELGNVSVDTILKLYDLKNPVRFPYGWVCRSSSFHQISIINGISVSRGGSHVNALLDNLTKYVEQRMKRGSGSKSLKPILKQSIFILFISSCPHPAFTSQDKVELFEGFPEKILIDENLREIWKVFDIPELILGREREKITNSNSTSSKRLKIKDLTDATFAGTKRSQECTLFLAEGLSALSFAKIGMKSVLDANFYGCYPIGGKILNVRKSKAERINQSETILNIEKILGLRIGSKNENLRYGKVVILKDADTDGAEIMGLVINFFHFNLNIAV